jgi:hypothetical protein
MRDELDVVPLVAHGLSSGILDPAWLARLGRAQVEGLRLIATAWGDVYQARFEGPVLAAGDAAAAALAESLAVLVDRRPAPTAACP